jgi:DNA-binding MurR/RpiR family transcriptional regulator
MNTGPLHDLIVREFQGMSVQLQKAARYVLDRPNDVALLSMREQARHAGVHPSTMTRFAKFIGLSGYDDVRMSYAAAVREGSLGFAKKAGEQVASQKLKGDKSLALEIAQSVTREIANIGAPLTLDRIVIAADILMNARRIYYLGLRSSHGVSWQLHYVLSLIGCQSVQLDGIAGTGSDALSQASDQDALFVTSVLPYTRLTMELAQYAKSRGVKVVALTDSEVSPLAQFADAAIFVSTESPSFFHTMAPAFVVVEILGSIIAGRKGGAALEALRLMDDHLRQLDTYQQSRNLKQPS